MMKKSLTLIPESFEKHTPSHWAISRANWGFSLDSPVVGEGTFFTASLHNARLSVGLVGISIVVGNLVYKSRFKLHVRRKHEGPTTDEESLISIT